MINAEQTAEIRRLFYAEHWKVGTIEAELGLHRDTITRAIQSDRFAPKARPVRPSKLDPYKEFIRDVLDKHPRLRATRIAQMLVARGYRGGIAQLRRYVRQVRPRRAEAYLRLQTLPGEQAQVDWGSFGKVAVGAAHRSLSCFVMVLSHSRAMWARFFYDQRLESFLAGHVGAFEALGGVPRQLLYDNLKSVVLSRHGDHVQYHPAILELAGHYHFAPRPCAPYRGNEKGKVERTIAYLRQSFFAARHFIDLDDLNAQLAHWIDTVAHQRPVPAQAPRQSVAEALTAERPRLLPLPEHRWPCEVVCPVRVGKTPYVRFDLNDYSVPHTHVCHGLTVIASVDALRIIDASQTVVARHRRSYDRAKRIEDADHIGALAACKRHAAELRGRDKLRALCPTAETFIEALARRNLPLAAQTAHLGRLLDRFGPSELDAAIADALARGAISAASVAHVLDQRRRRGNELPPLPVVLPDNARVRTLRVTEHDLSTYDHLNETKEKQP